MIPLYVLSEKGKKEEVSKVGVRPALGCGELVVESYTRDPSILKHGDEADADIALNGRGRLTLYAEGDEKKKLSAFAGYLKERGKAGIAKHDRNTIYLLPSTSSSSNGDNNDEVTLTCLATAKHREVPSTAAPASSSATSNSASQEKPKAKPAGLLGALVSKTNNTDAARTALMNKKDSEVRNKTVNYITRMETELKAKLQEFAEDPKQKVLRLEPMEKDYRYVVHDMVGLFETLLSASCGDMDERHVVIYKKGQEVPEGVEIHVSKEEMRAATMGQATERNKLSKKIEDAQYKVDLRQLQAMSTKVNVNKRDRRSIEELEAEAKEKKKSKTAD